MKKRDFYLAGGTIALLSAATIVDYAIRKKQRRVACAGALIIGIAGMLVGATLAFQPEHRARKALTVEDMLDEDDVELVNNGIANALTDTSGNGQNAKKVQTIELDEETSIDDFIPDPKFL